MSSIFAFSKNQKNQRNKQKTVYLLVSLIIIIHFIVCLCTHLWFLWGKTEWPGHFDFMICSRFHRLSLQRWITWWNLKWLQPASGFCNQSSVRSLVWPLFGLGRTQRQWERLQPTCNPRAGSVAGLGFIRSFGDLWGERGHEVWSENPELSC